MKPLGSVTGLRFARKVVTAGRSLKDNHAMIQLFDEAAPRRLSREDLKALALGSIAGAGAAAGDGRLTIAAALLDDAARYLHALAEELAK